jgi:hypothetical protein
LLLLLGLLDWVGLDVGDNCLVWVVPHLDIRQELFGWEIPHLDSLLSSNDEPVFLRSEEDDIDWGININLTKELAFSDSPDESETVLTT